MSSTEGGTAYPPFGLPLANNSYSKVGIDMNADGVLDGISWPFGELPWDGELADGGYTPKPVIAIAKNNLITDDFDLKHILGDPSVKNGVSFENQPDGYFVSKLDSALNPASW